MTWFCNTPEAIAQMKICDANKCPGCNKCIWIEESSNAMEKYGTVIEPELTVEEPYNECSQTHTVDRDDCGSEKNTPTKTFDSFEEKVNYIKEKFGGEDV